AGAAPRRPPLDHYPPAAQDTWEQRAIAMPTLTTLRRFGPAAGFTGEPGPGRTSVRCPSGGGVSPFLCAPSAPDGGRIRPFRPLGPGMEVGSDRTAVRSDQF